MNIYIVNCIIEAMQRDGQLGQAWVKTVGIFTDEDEARDCLNKDVALTIADGEYKPVELETDVDDFYVLVRHCEGSRGDGTRIALTMSQTDNVKISIGGRT
jgi:hypothetical protein